MRDALLDLTTNASCLGCGAPGRALCRACCSLIGLAARPTAPRPCPPGLLRVYAAADYDSVMRELVLAHKERGLHGLASPLGRVLAHVVLDMLSTAPADVARAPVGLVPVASHPAVVRARGHDPVLRISRRAAHELRGRGTRAGVRRLLRVVGRPGDQADLGADARRLNVAGRFRARPSQGHDSPATLVLVDDVITTGATLREAQRALEVAGWSPLCAVTLAATRLRRGLPDSGSGG